MAELLVYISAKNQSQSFSIISSFESMAELFVYISAKNQSQSFSIISSFESMIELFVLKSSWSNESFVLQAQHKSDKHNTVSPVGLGKCSRKWCMNVCFCSFFDLGGFSMHSAAAAVAASAAAAVTQPQNYYFNNVYFRSE